MFRRNKFLHRVLQDIGFWGVIVLALTAEGWMDLLCRLLGI